MNGEFCREKRGTLAEKMGILCNRHSLRQIIFITENLRVHEYMYRPYAVYFMAAAPLPSRRFREGRMP